MRKPVSRYLYYLAIWLSTGSGAAFAVFGGEAGLGITLLGIAVAVASATEPRPKPDSESPGYQCSDFICRSRDWWSSLSESKQLLWIGSVSGSCFLALILLLSWTGQLGATALMATVAFGSAVFAVRAQFQMSPANQARAAAIYREVHEAYAALPSIGKALVRLSTVLPTGPSGKPARGMAFTDVVPVTDLDEIINILEPFHLTYPTLREYTQFKPLEDAHIQFGASISMISTHISDLVIEAVQAGGPPQWGQIQGMVSGRSEEIWKVAKEANLESLTHRRLLAWVLSHPHVL